MVIHRFLFLDTNKPAPLIIMLMFTCFFMFVISFSSVNALTSRASQPLRGSVITCHNEGESVKVPLLTDDPCITCKCFNKEVVCQREVCPNFKSCYIIFYGKNRTCCDVCKDCWYDGRIYKSGETFTDKNELCTTFECNAGVITKYKPYCHVPCANAVRIQGECCPSCNHCELDGNVFKEGDEIPNTTNDPCIKCKCVQGRMICSKPACQVLPCPQSKWIIPKNECCPICKGHRKVFDFEGNCIMGLSAYREGQEYIYDQCTSCVCNRTTNICQRKVCPLLECPASYQVIEPGECCPKCHEPQEVQAVCSYNGQEYNNGDKWKINNCHKCSCIHGEVRCTADICSKDLVCPQRHKLMRLSGDCCKSCVEEDAQCKISDNLTKYNTFDGKSYTFKGQCNYILARDCKSRLFSVHLVNRIQNVSRNALDMKNLSLSLNSVMIKIEETKVRFGIKGRVRVSRKRVRLPHIKLGMFSIIRDGRKVVLRANIGVKVIWEEGESLKIIIPPDFKSKTCGLCGNYNNNPDDDFMTKRGHAITEIKRFTNSWRVGKNVICDNEIKGTTARIIKDKSVSRFSNSQIIRKNRHKNKLKSS